jgi:hypothetical protein
MGSQRLAVEFILNKNVSSSMNCNSVTHLKFMFSVLVCAVFNNCLSVVIWTVCDIAGNFALDTSLIVVLSRVSYVLNAIHLEPQNLSQVTSNLKS